MPICQITQIQQKHKQTQTWPTLESVQTKHEVPWLPTSLSPLEKCWLPTHDFCWKGIELPVEIPNPPNS